MPSNTETGRATARPWKIDDGGDGELEIWSPSSGSMDAICYMPGECEPSETERANAALIVRAVNHHEELVELVRELLNGIDGNVPADQMGNLRDTARALLTKIGATDG